MKFNLSANGSVYNFCESIENSSFKLEISNEKGHLVCSITPKEELHNLSFSVVLDQDYKKVNKIFANGYQSWTDSHEYDFLDQEKKPRFPMMSLNNKFAFTSYGDYNFVNYKKNVRHAVSYAYLRFDSSIKLIGSLKEKTGFTIIYFDKKRNKIKVEKDLNGLVIKEKYEILNVVTIEGEYEDVFDRYFKEINIKPLINEKKLGYTSWYKHYQNISEKIILDNIESIHNAKEDYKVFQIDDGFATNVGDWLVLNKEKFPNGLTSCVEKIKEYDMTPGVWLAPFSAEKNSTIYKNHPEWLIKDTDGKPLLAGGNWSGFAALDIYNDEVVAYLEKVFSTYKNYGFKLFKLDFLYSICVTSYNGKTRGEIMEDGMNLLRNLVGSDNMILGCGVPLFSAFGKVEYCRIGMDMGLDFDDTWFMRRAHRERVSTKNTMLNTIYRRHLNGRAFLNDPDVFLLRDDLKLSIVQRRNLAYINSLFGKLLFTSDDVSTYDEEKEDILVNSLEMFNSTVLSVKNLSKYVFDIKYITNSDEIKSIVIDIMAV